MQCRNFLPGSNDCKRTDMHKNTVYATDRLEKRVMVEPLTDGQVDR